MISTETVTSPGPKHHRSHLQWLSLVVSALLLLGCGYVIYHRIDTGEILQILLNLDQKWLIAAIAAYWCLFPINSLRFQRVFYWVRPTDSGVTLPINLIVKVTCSASFVAVAAPIGLIADVAKIGALRLFGGLSTTLAVRCTLIDRVVAAQWLSLFGLATLPVQGLLGVPSKLIGMQAAAAGMVIAGIIGLLAVPKVLGLFRNDLIAKIAHLFSGYRSTVRPRRLLVQLVFAFANLLMVWATLYFLLRAAGLTANLWLVACFVPFLQLINSVPFFYLGWGGREIAMAMTLGTVSELSMNEALALSAAWGVALIIVGAINGIFLLGDWRSHHKKHGPSK